MEKYNVSVYADEKLIAMREVYRISSHLFRIFKGDDEVLLGTSYDCRRYLDEWIKTVSDVLSVYREYNNLQFSINVVNEFKINDEK